MDHWYHLQIFLLFSVILSLTSGRALYYDELNSDDQTDLSSNQHEKQQNSQSKISERINNNADLSEFDSYEQKKFHQRSLFSTSGPFKTRQQLIDLLQKAYNQGWRPNLKHYIPATRFGRHGR